MKVNPSQSQSVQNRETSSTKKTSATSKPSESASPRTAGKLNDSSYRAELSDKAREMSKAKAAATSAPDVREDRVAELKRRISEGSYKVDADAIADRMYDEHLRMGGA